VGSQGIGAIVSQCLHKKLCEFAQTLQFAMWVSMFVEMNPTPADSWCIRW